MSIPDQDIVFTGVQQSSTPKNLIPAGAVSRLINARFVEGSISNAVGFDEWAPTYWQGSDKRVFASKVTYQELLNRGDVQLVAPLETITGKFQVMVISGLLFIIDLSTQEAYDITPKDAMLPISSSERRLSYLDNGGDVYGAGGYLVIFNYPNLPIFVSQDGARSSNPAVGEMPVARLGASAGNRVAIVIGANIVLISDPLGGAEALAPLTFTETTNPLSPFYKQTFNIGSALDVQYVTALCRMPKFLGPNQPFLAQNLLASSRRQKNILAVGLPRDQWASNQFITYAGTGDGVAGPLACTNIGDNVLYISSTGRIKTFAQDQTRETGLVETHLDDGLGQYTCCLESDYWHKPWYDDADHSYSLMKFNRDRMFASVYPVRHPAVGALGQQQYTPAHRALAVASLDSTTLLGPNASFTWEGFYDWCNPVGLITVGNEFYVTSKDSYGRNRYFKSNYRRSSEAISTVITRGYFNDPGVWSRSITSGYLYFKLFTRPMRVTISQLINKRWVCLNQGVITDSVYKFNDIAQKQRSEDGSVPLKIDIQHDGCRYELGGVKLQGEYHKNT